MKKFRLLAFVTAILLMASSAWSSQLGKELNEADAKLNTVYQQVLKGLPHDAAKERFKAAQRAWITWRDTEMALSQSLYEDGKTNVFMQLSLTQQRIKQLEAIGKRDTEFGYEEKP
jgi:uncharacterized protein YecT (DUF1311 family)